MIFYSDYGYNEIKKLNLSEFIDLKGYLSQHQIVKELHNNDILISASDVETFGVVLIEAQACGLPVIATNCGGPSDIISDETGILVRNLRYKRHFCSPR